MGEKLKKAIANSGKSIAAIAYEYNISLPTIHKCLRGESGFQPRINQALNKIITENKG